MSVTIPENGAAASAGDPYCYALGVFCTRWKPQILRAVGEDGKTRFSRFTKQLPISEKVLSAKLKELEEDGLIERSESAGPEKRVEYSLTELGRSVLPILRAIYDWGWHEMTHRGLEIDPLGEMWHGYRDRDEEIMNAPYRPGKHKKDGDLYAENDIS